MSLRERNFSTLRQLIVTGLMAATVPTAVTADFASSAGAAVSTAAARVFGIVTSAGASGFTVKAGTSTFTVQVTAATKYLADKKSVTFASVQKGLEVGVQATVIDSSHKVLRAGVVFVSPTAPQSSGHVGSAPVNVQGTASSVIAGGFTLSQGAKSVSVKVSAKTLYFESGIATPTYAAVKDAAVIGVTGTADASSTVGSPVLDAAAVFITPPPATPSATAAGALDPGGAVSSVTASSFIYTKGSSSAKVVLEPWTTYVLNGKPAGAASLSSSRITVGVAGRPDASSAPSGEVIDAVRVNISQSNAPGSGGTTLNGTPLPTTAGTLSAYGSVSQLTANSFVYVTSSKHVKIDLESYTTYAYNGAASTYSVLSTPNLLIAVYGILDATSTATNPVIDAIKLSTTVAVPVTSPTTSPSPTTPTSVPVPTADGTLPSGGTVSGFGASSFNYTNGSITSKVLFFPYTSFSVNGSTGPISTLTQPGVTVAVVGALDPSSTPGAKVVDALHINITTP